MRAVAVIMTVVVSLMPLALNVAAPLIAQEWGKAAFDAVGPLLLIGWAEVAPGLLQALGGTPHRIPAEATPTADVADPLGDGTGADSNSIASHNATAMDPPGFPNETTAPPCNDDLLERARQENARHWEAHDRPISAETLRKRLHVGAARSRMLAAESRCLIAARAACSKLISIAVMSASISRAEEPIISLICSRASAKASLARCAYRGAPSSLAYQEM